MARTDILNSIETKLKALDDPKYQGVYIGEPRRISAGSRVIAAWYTGEGERTRTMTQSMVAEEFQIRAYWKFPQSADAAEDIETEIWTAKAEITNDFHADSDLGGDVGNMHFGDVTTGWIEIGNVTYRVLSLVLRLTLLNEETISA